MNKRTKKIGFIGQGWIGKHYADDFENRGFKTVRYALEEPYNKNKDRIAECEITIIAVPTPSTPDGYSFAPVEHALQNIKPKSTAVIKSTLLPGTTKKLQDKFPNLYVMHSPEFLREANAAYDAANPDRNIIGIPSNDEEFKTKAEEVLSILPQAPYKTIMPSFEAEFVKYAGNCFLYSKVVFMNAFRDMMENSGGNYEVVREAMSRDPRIGSSHTNVVHASGHDTSDTRTKRGAGGHCFIKDFEAFRNNYKDVVGENEAFEMLNKIVNYNIRLLHESDKDVDLLEGVYGSEVFRKDFKL